MEETSIWMSNATLFYQKKNYAAAEECYSTVIRLLRRQLLSNSLASQERANMREFMSSVAQRILRIREDMQSSLDKTDNTSTTKPIATSANSVSHAVSLLHQTCTTAKANSNDSNTHAADGAANARALHGGSASSAPVLPRTNLVSGSTGSVTRAASAQGTDKMQPCSRIAVANHRPSSTCNAGNSPNTHGIAHSKNDRNDGSNTADDDVNNVNCVVSSAINATSQRNSSIDVVGVDDAKGLALSDPRLPATATTLASDLCDAAALCRASAPVRRVLHEAMAMLGSTTPRSDDGGATVKRVHDWVRVVFAATAATIPSPHRGDVDLLRGVLCTLRRRYYRMCPPRFLQDNSPTAQEMALLRRNSILYFNHSAHASCACPQSGSPYAVTRNGVGSSVDSLRLPIWDDRDVGYAAENMHYPREEEQAWARKSPTTNNSHGSNNASRNNNNNSSTSNNTNASMNSSASSLRWDDVHTISLNAAQRKAGAILRHYTELDWPMHTLAIVRDSHPLSITQSCVGDCSMVCCLINCASYRQRFPHTSIVRRAIYPQDSRGFPCVNACGKYAVKMLINGMTRMVCVDDRVPVRPGRVCRLMCTTSDDPTEMWVTLLEKAFLQVNSGSYEFDGSNSGRDLYKLAGWLPTSVDLNKKGNSTAIVDRSSATTTSTTGTTNTHDKNNDVDYAAEWKRLVRSFHSGAVMASFMSQSDLPESTEKMLELPARHSYALLNVAEVNNIPVLLLCNPWQTPTWRGQLSTQDKSAQSVAVHTALGLTAESAAKGAFCISWADVCRYFDTVSYSWNPYMLFPDPTTGAPRKPTRLAYHGVLTTQAPMVQLHVHIHPALTAATQMHVVLSRHRLYREEAKTVTSTTYPTRTIDAAAAAADTHKSNTLQPLVEVNVFNVSSHLANLRRSPVTTTRSKGTVGKPINAKDVAAGETAGDVTSGLANEPQPSYSPPIHCCTLDSCVCPQLASNRFVPRQCAAMNKRVLRPSEVFGESVTCTAGVTDLIVLIRVEYKESAGTGPAGPAEDRTRETSFSVTLHTKLPAAGLRTSGGAVEDRSRDEAETGVYMHAIPSSNPCID